jgi:hypothetical protein
MKRKTNGRSHFSALKGAARNEAKRYRLPAGAVDRIRDAASKWYGTQSRAIQVAAELLFRHPGDFRYPGELRKPATAAMTYKLDPRTIAILHHLAKTPEYGTHGRVLNACSCVLGDTPETPRV